MGAGLGGLSFGGAGFGSGGIGGGIFDEEGFLVGFSSGFSLGVSGFDLGAAFDLGGGFGGFSVGPGGVLIGQEVISEAPTQEDINAAIEAEIEAERQADPGRFGGGGGEDPEGGVPGVTIGIPTIVGGLGGPQGGPFTLQELNEIAVILGVPISSILETETPIEEEGVGEPPEEVVPAPGRDVVEDPPPCRPQDCPPPFLIGLPPIILRPVIELLRTLTLRFPFDINIQRQFDLVLQLARSNQQVGGVVDGPPDATTFPAEACGGFFREVQPGCRCICQVPVRSCCGGSQGCDCEPC